MPCPEDTFATPSGTCQPCDPGTTSSSASLECNTVPPGFYNDGSGLKICGPGTSSEVQFGSTTCVACELGSYARDPGSAECTLCGLGTYADEIGSTQCNVCPDGTAAIEYGATSIDECTPLPPLLQYSSPIFDDAACDDLLVADLLLMDMTQEELEQRLAIRQQQVGGTSSFLITELLVGLKATIFNTHSPTHAHIRHLLRLLLLQMVFATGDLGIHLNADTMEVIVANKLA